MKGKLRGWVWGDIGALENYANNLKIANNLRDTFPSPYTRKDAEAFINIARQFGKDEGFVYAIDIDGVAIGSIGIVIKGDGCSKFAEIGYWLAEDFWQKGIMTEAIQRVCAITFEKYHIARIEAECFEWNVPSQMLLKKCGFLFEGRLRKRSYKNGSFCDSFMYALIQK